MTNSANTKRNARLKEKHDENIMSMKIGRNAETATKTPIMATRVILQEQRGKGPMDPTTENVQNAEDMNNYLRTLECDFTHCTMTIKSASRQVAPRMHPDKGGSTEDLQHLSSHLENIMVAVGKFGRKYLQSMAR